MLVLSRKSNECIRIGGEVTVTVLQIEGSRVRIGIDAPPAVHVLRAELAPARGSARGDPTDERRRA